MSRRITIRDVAQASGVAVSTASNALSDKGEVSVDTRARVRRIAAELGYQPSGLGRALRLKRTGVIAMVVADILHPFAALVARGVTEAAFQHGWTTLLCDTACDLTREQRYLDLLRQQGADGVILTSSPIGDTNLDLLKQHELPYVLVSRGQPGQIHDYVGVDIVQGMGQIIDHLVSLGHRHIVLAGGESESSVVQGKRAAFHDALDRHNLEHELTLVGGGFDYADGLRIGRRLLAQQQQLSAIVAINDMVALGIIEAAEERGRAVPTKLSVVGWDDAFPAGMRRVFLTTVRQPAYEMGQAALELLAERIVTPDAAHQEIVMPVEFIVRGTTSSATVSTSTESAASRR
jgi:LacI family transcriptional regulator